MALPRVARDIPADEYWRDRAARYAATIDGPYHADRNRMIARLLDGVPLEGASAVDFGCGEGVTVQQLASAGATVLGLDPSEELVADAISRLEAAGIRPDIRVGGVAELEQLDAGSSDLLVALNVLAYMTEDEERAFYAAARRVLRAGGALVVTHSNELFDLFTLNAYTVDFFARHFVGPGHAADVARLLRHPDLPRRTTFNVRENPLAYGEKLQSQGFAERRLEYAHHHDLPPLIAGAPDPDDIDAHRYRDVSAVEPAERWKLMFQCSMFGVRAERLP